MILNDLKSLVVKQITFKKNLLYLFDDPCPFANLLKSLVVEHSCRDHDDDEHRHRNEGRRPKICLNLLIMLHGWYPNFCDAKLQPERKREGRVRTIQDVSGSILFWLCYRCAYVPCVVLNGQLKPWPNGLHVQETRAWPWPDGPCVPINHGQILIPTCCFAHRWAAANSPSMLRSSWSQWSPCRGCCC